MGQVAFESFGPLIDASEADDTTLALGLLLHLRYWRRRDGEHRAMHRVDELAGWDDPRYKLSKNALMSLKTEQDEAEADLRCWRYDIPAHLEEVIRGDLLTITAYAAFIREHLDIAQPQAEAIATLE